MLRNANLSETLAISYWNERRQRLRPGQKRGGAVEKSRLSLPGICFLGPLEINLRQLEAARDHLEAGGGDLDIKIECFITIYYKTWHRAPKTCVFTCFCQLGTPKPYDYLIIYMLYSTFWKRAKTALFRRFLCKGRKRHYVHYFGVPLRRNVIRWARSWGAT